MKKKPATKTRKSPSSTGNARKKRASTLRGGAEEDDVCPLSRFSRAEIIEDDPRKVYNMTYGNQGESHDQCYDLCYLYTYIHSPGTGPNGEVMDPLTLTKMSAENLWLIDARYADVLGDRLCKKHTNSYRQASASGAQAQRTSMREAPSQQVINALAWQPPTGTNRQAHAPNTENNAFQRAMVQSIASERANAARRRERQASTSQMNPGTRTNQASTSAFRRQGTGANQASSSAYQTTNSRRRNTEVQQALLQQAMRRSRIDQ